MSSEPETGAKRKRSEARRVRKLDRYEIIAELARGGMATVYLARLLGAGGFERLLAIKMMHPHLADEAHFVTMFLDEARLAAKLHHPNAVAITDVCTTTAGNYLVMEYVDGFTLAHLLRRKDVPRERRVRLGLRILLDAAIGLDAAHRLKDHRGESLKIVHRDVSPSNIMVGCNGIGRITDFGIAHAATRITASRPGTIKGKFQYMAPEQALGSEVDCRADVFGLGIILWETLVGRKLFYDEAGDAATIRRVIQAEIPAPSAESGVGGEALDAICLRALERDKEERYPSARELVVDLEKTARDAGLLATTTEVSDAIAEIFADRLRARWKAIGDCIHDEMSMQEAVSTSDLVSVPRLSALTAEEHSDSGPGATPSMVKPAGSSDFPTVPADGLSPGRASLTDIVSRARKPAPVRSVIFAMALGVGAALAAAFALDDGSDQGLDPVGGAPTVTPTVDDEVPPVEEEAALEPEPEPAVAANEVVTTRDAGSTQPDAGSAQTTVRNVQRRSRPRPSPAPRRGSEERPPAPTSMASTSDVVFEDNPYLRR